MGHIPAPAVRHQRILRKILTRIAIFLEERPCEAFPAPFDVVLRESPDQPVDDSPTVVQPDISVICDTSKITEAGCTGAPDLVVEILSPSTSRKDTEVKRKLYERHGIREYWIVDPGNRCFLVSVLAEGGTYPEEPTIYAVGTRPERPVLGSVVLEGFGLDLNLVFGG